MRLINALIVLYKVKVSLLVSDKVYTLGGIANF